MININPKFAETQSSGIGAFNINLKAFLFQLATFVIVLLVLRKWVFPKLIATLEARRQTVEDSLVKAKQTEEALAKAEEKAAQIMREARDQADKALAEANTQAKDDIAKASATAESQAQRLISEAHERLAQDRQKLHDELSKELAALVSMTTEKVLSRKVNEQEDRRLIQEAIKDLIK